MGIKVPLRSLYPRTRQGRANSHTCMKPARRQQTACSSTSVGCRVGLLIIGLLDSLLLPGTCQPGPAGPQVEASVSHHNESTLEQLPFLLEPCWRKAGQGELVSCLLCHALPSLLFSLECTHPSHRLSLLHLSAWTSVERPQTLLLGLYHSAAPNPLR